MKASENPFRVSLQESFAFEFPENDDWEKCLDRLANLNFRAGIVGPKGRGKTTFLLELEAQLTQRGFLVDYLFLNIEKRQFSVAEKARLRAPMTPNRFLILDGAEQLNFWQFRRFCQKTAKAGGLVISTHTQRRLPILLEAQSSFDRFEQFVHSLLKTHPELKKLSEKACLRQIFAKFDGNVRDCLRELYHHAAEL